MIYVTIRGLIGALIEAITVVTDVLKPLMMLTVHLQCSTHYQQNASSHNNTS